MQNRNRVNRQASRGALGAANKPYSRSPESHSRDRGRDSRRRSRERRSRSPDRRERNDRSSGRFERPLRYSESRQRLRLSPRRSIEGDMNDVMLPSHAFGNQPYSPTSEILVQEAQEAYSGGVSLTNNLGMVQEQQFLMSNNVEIVQSSIVRFEEPKHFQAPQLNFQPQVNVSNTFDEQTVPDFDPQNAEISARNWISLVSETAKKHNWTEDEKKYFMSSKLKGAAKQWYITTNKVQEPWHRITQQFYQAFPSDMEYASLLRAMMNREKQSDESYATYFDSKTGLLNNCGITGGKAVSCIIGGIKNTQLRKDAYKQNFSDINTLYQYVRQYEQMEITMPDQTLTKKGKLCRSCNNYGHLAKFCNALPVNDTELPVIMYGALSEVLTLKKYFVKVNINGVDFLGYIDVKSMATTVKEATLQVANVNYRKSYQTISGFNRSIISSIGETEVTMKVDKAEASVAVYVIPDHIQAISVVVGQNFLSRSDVLFVEDEEIIHLYKQSEPNVLPFSNMQNSYINNSLIGKCYFYLLFFFF